MTVLTDLLPVSLIMAERKLQVRDQDEQHALATIVVRPMYAAGFAYKSSRTCVCAHQRARWSTYTHNKNDLGVVLVLLSQGVFNFCNPGAISHNEILDLYKQVIDPTFEYSNFTIEEQDKILVAKRSNNTLVSGSW